MTKKELKMKEISYKMRMNLRIKKFQKNRMKTRNQDLNTSGICSEISLKPKINREQLKINLENCGR
jgi:hypothetical protein